MIGLMRMKFKMIILFIAFGIAVGIAAPVQAVSIDAFVGGPWLEFSFGGPGTVAVDCAGACIPSSGGNSIDAGDPPWTLLAGGLRSLTVTDAFLSVDTFAIFDFGVLIGVTSVPTPGGSCGSDPAVCSVDPNYSHGIFSLSGGPHSIQILHVVGVPGAGYFRVDSAVPEPSTLLLFGSGLAGLGLWQWKRRKGVQV